MPNTNTNDSSSSTASLNTENSSSSSLSSSTGQSVSETVTGMTSNPPSSSFISSSALDSSSFSSSFSSTATSDSASSSTSSSSDSSSESSTASFEPIASNITTLTILQQPSPFFRKRSWEPSYIILHTIGYNNPLEILLQNNVSYHYVIPLQNSTQKLYAIQSVDDANAFAFHAGASEWRYFGKINEYSIGIALHMPNFARALEGDALDFMHFENYQAEQITALKMLVKPLMEKYDIRPNYVLGHSDIAPWRNNNNKIVIGKTDPGPTLPWEELAKANIGVTPIDDCSDFENWYPADTELTARDAQVLLRQVGYAAGNSNKWDMQTNSSIYAARSHWTPRLCFNNHTQSAAACYEEKFPQMDRELACKLYNVGYGKVKDYSEPKEIWPLILGGLGFLGVLTLLCFIIKKCEKYSRTVNRYQQFSADSYGNSRRGKKGREIDDAQDDSPIHTIELPPNSDDELELAANRQRDSYTSSASY